MKRIAWTGEEILITILLNRSDRYINRGQL